MQYKSYIVEENPFKLKENFVLFYGENDGLKQEIKNKIKKHNKESEILNLNQEDILKNKNFLNNEINTNSLFDKKKIFIINNVNDKLLDLFQNIVRINKSDKIYIFSELLDKKSKLRNFFENEKLCACIACYEDNEITIKRIIQNKLKGFNGLNSYNLNIILEQTGLNRAKLNNELEKIKTYFLNKELISEELGSLLDIRSNDNFNLLKDEALLGNKAKTNKLLGYTVLETEKNIYYLNLINQRLIRLSEVRSKCKNGNLDRAVNELRPPVFWKDKPNFIQQSKKWNSNKIKEILKHTYNLEVKIKSNSTINKEVLIRKLILDICNLANS